MSFGILSLGHGLHNTLIGMRATIEHYPDWLIGIMMSVYFLGFLAGTAYCDRVLPRIGHIRTFAALASLASSISLIHVLFVNEITWIICRFVYGVCISSLYMVIESWLNALSTTKTRGRILSIYMIVSFLCLSLGQTFVVLAEPSKYILFALVSILISLSLMPLTLSRAEQPELYSSEPLGFRRLFMISPLATIGSLATGLIIGAFWGLAAVFFIKVGFSTSQAALAISISYLGGLVFQYPIGYLSDLFDRRITIVGVLVASAVVTLSMAQSIASFTHLNVYSSFLCFMFGAFVHTLYSLFIALANDFLQPEQVIKATGGLISLHAVGAIFGPIMASLLMSAIGPQGLLYFIVVVALFVSALAIYQVILGRKIPEETIADFVSIPRTGLGIVELDPRQED